MDLHQISSVALARLIKRREVTAVAALEYFLDRVKQFNPALNAVVVERFEEARQRAQEADEALTRGEDWGPLHGVPMTVKETFEIAGWPTTAGIPELREHVSESTSVAVRKLLDAGVVIFGKTNVPPFASDLQSYNDIYGTTNNPWNTELTPGGSSGGAAAAVAAGMTPLELGSDIGGSIRTPAAFCGICGLKPSWGVVSTRGHVPGPPGALARRDISVSGPLAHHVEDLELALDILAGPDQEDAPGWRLSLPEPRHGKLADFRVAAWLDDPRCPVDAPIRQALEALVVTLRDQGLTVEDAARPEGFDLAEAHDVYYSLLTGTMGEGLPEGLYQKLQANAEQEPAAAGDYRTLFARGATQSHAQWLRTSERRMQMRQAWDAFFQRHDILLCPVVQTLPFTHRQEPGPDQRTLTINGEEQPYMDILVWAGLAGAVYLPAVSLPLGISADGRPLAVQIVGPYLEDRTALAFARQLQALLPAMPSPPI